MKKVVKLALGAAAIGAGVKLYKMPSKDRADMLSRGFVKTISKFSSGLPEPAVNSDAEEISGAEQKDLICENAKDAKWVLGYSQFFPTIFSQRNTA